MTLFRFQGILEMKVPYMEGNGQLWNLSLWRQYKVKGDHEMDQIIFLI
jgi:hypothetical protein